MELGATAILPLRHAAEEAWMSIMALHLIAALLRLGRNRKGASGRRRETAGVIATRGRRFVLLNVK